MCGPCNFSARAIYRFTGLLGTLVVIKDEQNYWSRVACAQGRPATWLQHLEDSSSASAVPYTSDGAALNNVA